MVLDIRVVMGDPMSSRTPGLEVGREVGAGDFPRAMASIASMSFSASKGLGPASGVGANR